MITQSHRSRLFTYKVSDDNGSAPNPFFGLCTLAICKPSIRRVASEGDIVVGFGCKSGRPKEEYRVVYLMCVQRILPWPEYIDLCRTELRERIPNNTSLKRFAGDCIYEVEGGSIRREPRPSLSHHSSENYAKDVERGRNVLLSRRYWYFGAGNKHRIVVPDALTQIVPRYQGHRSLSNQPYVAAFVRWFNGELASRRIRAGVHGTPRDWPLDMLSDACESAARSARAAVR